MKKISFGLLLISTITQSNAQPKSEMETGMFLVKKATEIETNRIDIKKYQEQILSSSNRLEQTKGYCSQRKLIIKQIKLLNELKNSKELAETIEDKVELEDMKKKMNADNQLWNQVLITQNNQILQQIKSVNLQGIKIKTAEELCQKIQNLNKG